MRNTMVLIASLVALLAFTPGTLAQDAGSGTPAATPVPAVDAFKIGPEPGADPATTDQGFFVYELAAGDEADGSVRLTNPGTEPVTVELVGVDAETAQVGGSAFADAAASPVAVGSWVQLDESQVTLESGEETLVYFTVVTPADTAPGQYLAGITAFVPAVKEASTSDTGQAGASVTMQTRYVIGVQVDVPGEWTPAMTITGAEAMENPSGTRLGITMTNTGDTFIKPQGKVTLSNAASTPILEQPIEMGTFLTNTDLTYPVAWPGVPAGGEYGVEVELNYADDQVARYSGMLTVSDDAPIAVADRVDEPQSAADPASASSDETQPAAAPAPAPAAAPATVAATSFLQPWMIMTIIGLLALLVVAVIVLVVVMLRNRRNSSAW
jgi:hypothetical protein